MTSPFCAIHLDDATGSPPVVRLEGELDLAATAELSACFERVLATGAAIVQVDLAEVSFIDSSALAVLVSAARQLRWRSGRLVVTAASPFVLRTLDIAGLAADFSLADADPPRGQSA